MKKAMFDVLADYYGPEEILYVKTAGNPRTPVPVGWHVRRIGDGLAEVTEHA